MYLLPCLLALVATAQGATTSSRRSTGGDWKAAEIKANAFILKLSSVEKAAIVTGNSSAGGCIGNISPISRLGFRGICTQDGPTALNRADLVSIFPAGITVAASWDEDLMYQRANALASEFREKGIHVLLGPSAGPLGRHALGGRNWEGFSPDPYLTGRAMDNSIRGIQDTGVQAVAKHFIGNEQETQRTNIGDIEAISANIDDRTMHELYLWPFANAVKAGTASLMCGYNKVNQTYACENSPLLNDILKKELGFKGYVMSDFFAVHSGVKSMTGGLDMNMPGSIDVAGAGIVNTASYYGGNITTAVNNGSLSLTRLDDMIRRIMTPYFLLGQDEDFPTEDPSNMAVLATHYGQALPISQEISARDVRHDHATLIRTLGAAGCVLLKNVNATLPLTSSLKHIGVFGNDAPDLSGGMKISNRDSLTGTPIGTLDIGGGSGSGRHTSIVAPLEAIKARAAKSGFRVSYIIDNGILAAGDLHSIYPTPEICLVFLKTYASEGFDRVSFEADWNSTLVVEKVAKRCPNTVVITHSGGVNTMPWASNPNVKAIIAAHYPGEQTGNAIVDILWGAVNPSGRLPYTIPKQRSDCEIPIVNLTSSQVTNSTSWQADFTEGQFIDYRAFDAKNVTPLYEFGFGLSYTAFDLSASVKTKVLAKNIPARPTQKPVVPGGNPELWTDLVQVSTKVSNTGKTAGATVVQLYVSMPDGSAPKGTPLRVLRGFKKVYLEAGKSKNVEMLLQRRDLSYWDVTLQDWVLPKGEILIQLGFSSRDLKTASKVKLL